ncbi:uncharacterized protein [Antedon mediterranea]|uniref:uncharacterized protein n=1 Tax=Antedon mediterranea TaxID=105859 RepID=UPI003AF43C49
MLFQCADLSPKTKAWNNLINQSYLCVRYFESLPKAGQALSKAHILLFLTIMHNFVATRNRLFPTEHSRLLPYIQVCVPFCESYLVKSDVWADIKAHVYGSLITTSSSAICSNEILHYESLNRYRKRFVMLKAKAKAPGKLQEDQVQRSIRRWLDSSKTLLPRMLFALAVLYYKARCYKGMNYFLSELDKQNSADICRVRMITNISSEFKRYLMHYNNISKEENESLLKNCWKSLKGVAASHKNMMRRFGKTSNIMQTYVDSLFQIRDDRPNIRPKQVKYGSDDWCTLMRTSEEVAEYINNLGEGGRGISQGYIHFMVDFMMKFMAACHIRFGQNHMRDIRYLLSCIKLFRALDTSIFTAKLKKTVCNMAALHMSSVDENEDFTKIMEECVREVEICQSISALAGTHQHKVAPDWFSYEENDDAHLQEETEYELDEGEKEELDNQPKAVPTTIESTQLHLNITGKQNVCVSNAQHITINFLSGTKEYLLKK